MFVFPLPVPKPSEVTATLVSGEKLSVVREI